MIAVREQTGIQPPFVKSSEKALRDLLKFL
jgi:hypothetical protein